MMKFLPNSKSLILACVLRCAGYNNVNLKSAYENKIHVAFQLYSLSQQNMLCAYSFFDRHIHKAYIRSRDFNFNLKSLTGFDMHGKTIGVIGTGKIGRVFVDIAKGFGMKVLCYDPYPIKDNSYEYTTLEEIYRQADIISLHCPLSPENHHMINEKAISQMKKGVMIINTSRGGLIDSKALLEGLKEKKIGSVGRCLRRRS